MLDIFIVKKSFKMRDLNYEADILIKKDTALIRMKRESAIAYHQYYSFSEKGLQYQILLSNHQLLINCKRYKGIESTIDKPIKKIVLDVIKNLKGFIPVSFEIENKYSYLRPDSFSGPSVPILEGRIITIHAVIKHRRREDYDEKI